MSIFSDTMTRAISDYRTLLRRHLTQVERMTRLQKLNLRDADLYQNEISLYEAGKAIIADMEENAALRPRGYYSYSGIRLFCDYLKTYLANYYIENDQLVHRAQKASRALLGAIQLTSLPREQLGESSAKILFECNETIVTFGSDEQCDLQLQTLSQNQANNPGFYTRIIAHLESLMMSRCSEAA